MSYKVTRSFYVGDSLHEYGTEFRSEDQEQVKQLLEDGNIEEVSVGGESAPSTPADGGSESSNPLAEQPVDGASPSPETPAPEVNAPQTVQPVQEAPTQVPVQTVEQEQTQAPHNPTQAEIEQTLKDSGLDSESSNDVQIS